MFARLLFFKLIPERTTEVKRIYFEEIVPVLKKQNGNVAVFLLEPNDKSEDFISLTKWKTKTDADNYENNGTYKKMVAKLESCFSKEPKLKTYNVEETRIYIPDTL